MKISEQSRYNQLAYIHSIMRSGDPFAIMSVPNLLISLGIKDSMHKGKQSDNPSFFIDSVDNTCEFYMGQLLYHFNVNSNWSDIIVDLDYIKEYLNEVRLTSK